MLKKSRAKGVGGQEIGRRVVWGLGLVLFLNLFMFAKMAQAGMVLLLLGLAGYVLACFGGGGEKRVRGRVGLVMGIVMGIVAVMMLLVGSGVRVVALIWFSLMMMVMVSYLLLKKQAFVGSLSELVLSPIVMVGEYLRRGLHTARAVLNGSWRGVVGRWSGGKGEQSAIVKSLAIGVLVGLPIVSWLVLMLTKADPIFDKFVKELVSEEFLRELPARLWWSLVLFVLIVPVAVMRLPARFSSPVRWIARGGWIREMAVVSGMVVGVVGTFLLVQYPYVFVSVAKETELVQYGVATYSEYVQKGFVELLKVGGALWGVLWAGLLVWRGKEERGRRALAVLQGVLTLELVVFVASIGRRVWLYQQYHGASLARLYGVMLLVWLAGMVVTLVGRYLARGVRWVRVEAVWLALVVLVTMGINMEQVVVKNPPTVNGRVDYVYLSRLSEDGYEGWVKAYEWAEGVLVIKDGEVINKDKRREVAYAGAVVRELSHNYHELIMQYGSEEEVEEYVEFFVARVREFEDEGRNYGMDYRPVSEHLVWGENMDLQVSIGDEHSILRRKYSQENWYYDNVWMYVVEDEERERLVGWDKLLSWSYVGQRTYERMRDEIGIEELIQLQRSYATVYAHILRQPEGERDYEVDISTASPLLR